MDYASNPSIGDLQYLTMANPAAGAGFTFTLPTDARVQILGLRFTLTTSGVAGNRIPNWVLRKSGSIGVAGGSGGATSQAASLARQWMFWRQPDPAVSTFTSNIIKPLPNTLEALPGDDLLCFVSAIDVADQISDIWLTVRSWRLT